MKNTIRVLGAILLGSLLVLAGCSNALDNLSNGGDVGTLLVQLGGVEANARTLGPDTSGFSYELKIEDSSNVVLSVEPITGGSSQVTLGAPSSYYNTYYVTVTGYTGTGAARQDVAVSEKTSVRIYKNQTATANLFLYPIVEDANSGYLDYELIFQDLTLTGGAMRIAAITSWPSPTTPDYGNFNVNIVSESERAKKISLPPGQYRLTFSGVTTDQYLYGTALGVSLNEVVHIFPTLTTEAKFTFTEADVTALVKLSGDTTVTNNVTGTTYKAAKVYIRDQEGKSVLLGDVKSDGKWEFEVPTYNRLDNNNNGYQASLQLSLTSGTKEIRSAWQTVYLNDKFGGAGNNLSASVYSFTISTGLTNGTITPVNKDGSNNPVLEAVADSEVQLQIAGTGNYGYVTGSLSGGNSYPTAKSFIMPWYNGAMLSAQFVPKATTYTVGSQGPAGGVIFYIAKDAAEESAFGGKYVEVAPNDGYSFGSTVTWVGTTSYSVGTTKTDIGSGKQNTAAIIDFYESPQGGYNTPYAARNSSYYSAGGFGSGNWFLPSRDEFAALAAIVNPSGGGFTAPATFTALNTGDYYWTSSENGSYSAYCYYLYSGGGYYNSDGKTSYYYVRPIHAFSIE